MNKASLWRIALAERICQPYIDHLNVQAITVVGSAAYGWADRYSDIERIGTLYTITTILGADTR